MTTAIRRFVDYQADAIERFLGTNRAPVRVTGGTVGPRLIRFYLQPAPGVRLRQIATLSDDLAMALRVRQLTVSRGDAGPEILIPRQDPQPVDLLSLIDEIGPNPQTVAVLGMTADGSPLLARLASPDVAHVLIAGTTGSGKSVLLRTIAASLALTHEPHALRLLCLDPKRRAFASFVGAAHLLRPPLSESAEISEVLRSLVRLMEARDREHASAPRIVVCIDELADVIMATETAADPLTRLAQRGREAGIHLVAATQYPSAAILGGVMRANFPLRIVGRVVSADDARVASGRAGTEAHTLTGQGDFLAVAGGQVIRFQAARIAETDLRRALQPARARPAQPELLPERDDAEMFAPASLDPEALAMRLAPWWEDHGGVWGSKTAACRFLFGSGITYAGYYARLTDAAIAMVENREQVTA